MVMHCYCYRCCSGLWLGFILGCIQMFIYLLYDKPWTIAAGGLIVGIITNAIAIKLIFEPVRVLQSAIYIHSSCATA
jgi:hypothetical protein